MRFATSFAVGTCIAASLILTTGLAEAAPPFAERPITLPRHDWSFDIGLGIAHDGRPPEPAPRPTGAGMNLDVAVGLTSRLELGVRGGVRFGSDGKATRADQYGRLYDRQTFGTGFDTFANPEARITGALVRTDVVELALEGRVYMPFEDHTYFGGMFGMPLRFHIADAVRIDTGVYVPVVFNDPDTFYAFSVPAHIWFQATDRFWLGPMTGIRFTHYNRNNDATDVALGFGLGYQAARILDFKTMLFWPGINHEAGARTFGAGVGLQIRIE
jgi:hypothetical protein